MTTTIHEVMSYIRTFSGRLVDPIHLKPEDVCIEDIAHSLSNQCRFSGHTSRFYSVAEHSVNVMKHCTIDPLAALLHDASEAYLVDVPRPLKRHPGFEFYREVEAHVSSVIGTRFTLLTFGEVEEEIHTADKRMLATEMRALMRREDIPDHPLPFEPYADYANVKLGMDPKEAEKWFLATFYALVS